MNGAMSLLAHRDMWRPLMVAFQGKCANIKQRTTPALQHRLTMPCFVKCCSCLRYSGD